MEIESNINLVVGCHRFDKEFKNQEIGKARIDGNWHTLNVRKMS